MQEKYINKLLEKVSIKDNNDVPVCALIVHKDKIIAISTNNREKKHNVLGHAEINCILKANKKLKTWKLYDCDMYVTLKPCEMCERIINESRIRNVYYLIDKLPEKYGYNQTKMYKIINTNFEDEYRVKLSNFFSNMR